MLSAVLRGGRAIQMSINIIRAFIRMRELIASNKDIAARVKELERGHARTASVIEVLAEDIDRLAHDVRQMKTLPVSPKRNIDCDAIQNQRATKSTRSRCSLLRALTGLLAAQNPFRRQLCKFLNLRDR